VDVVFVGPGDLSVSLDAWRPEGAQKLVKAIEKIIKSTLKHGKTAGIFCGRPDDIGRWTAAGASFFILASDTMFLGGATASGLADARAAWRPAKAKRVARR
jgi:4-hydroxy-2-oxoheptanedioate aldolase